MAPYKAAQSTLTLDPFSPSPAGAAMATPKSISTLRVTSSPVPPASSASSRPRLIPPDVPEFFIPRRDQLDAGSVLLYRPAILGVARLHYADIKTGTDHWETLGLLRPVVDELPADIWDGAEAHADYTPELNKTPEPGAHFGPLPGTLARAKAYSEYTKG